MSGFCQSGRCQRWVVSFNFQGGNGTLILNSRFLKWSSVRASLPWPCTASRSETLCTQRPPPAWPPPGRSPTPGLSPVRWPDLGRGTPRQRRSSGRPRSPASGGAERRHPGCSFCAWRRAGRGGAAGGSSGSSARRQQRTYRGVCSRGAGLGAGCLIRSFAQVRSWSLVRLSVGFNRRDSHVTPFKRSEPSARSALSVPGTSLFLEAGETHIPTPVPSSSSSSS